MRVGIVTYDYDPPIGGLGTVAKLVRSALKRLCPDNTYLVLSPSPHADDCVSTLAAKRWNRRGGCPLFSLILAFRLPSLLREHQLDLLHVHAGSGGVFLLRKPLIPVVVTSHHTYLQEAEMVFISRPVTRFWKKIMSRFERRTYRLADRIICVSFDTAAFLIDRYRIDAAKVSVVENGILTPVKPAHVKKNPHTVLFIGRIEERKGIWVLLNAFRLLRSTHPDAHLRLVGKNLVGGRLEQFIADSGIGKNVTVTGYVHDPLMRRELAEAAVLVVPSLLEGFGLIAAEAMMLGTCVIVSDTAGLKSIVKHGQTGLMFPSGDSVQCAREIATVLDSPALRKTLEENAMADAVKRFGYEQRAKDVQKVFDSILLN